MAPDDARDAAPLSERVEIAGREIDVEDDYDYGYEDEGDAPLVPAKKVPNGSVYEAARAGDVERLTWLVHEEGVDVNARDRWDSVPLYYACLAGQLEAARVLLEAGAICSEHTAASLPASAAAPHAAPLRPRGAADPCDPWRPTSPSTSPGASCPRTSPFSQRARTISTTPSPASGVTEPRCSWPTSG
ncbi:hypothetical protein CLOM_g13989 [Closterium sp. NIES-68]|nr:hypothetical protein CLOM_g13989 [Closterium sp. NIES-68]